MDREVEWLQIVSFPRPGERAALYTVSVTTGRGDELWADVTPTALTSARRFAAALALRGCEFSTLPYKGKGGQDRWHRVVAKAVRLAQERQAVGLTKPRQRVASTSPPRFETAAQLRHLAGLAKSASAALANDKDECVPADVLLRLDADAGRLTGQIKDTMARLQAARN